MDNTSRRDDPADGPEQPNCKQRDASRTLRMKSRPNQRQGRAKPKHSTVVRGICERRHRRY